MHILATTSIATIDHTQYTKAHEHTAAAATTAHDAAAVLAIKQLYDTVYI